MPPLSEEKLVDWSLQLNLRPETIELIRTIRSSPPSRRVGGGPNNMIARYPSEKMGYVIQAESHKVSFAGVREYEYDNDVLEYYDEPAPIKLNYSSRTGKSVGVMHTPDYFLIRHGCAGWEEWKTEDELEKLSVEMPNRYQRDENGNWRCPPGEEYAQRRGLYYRLRSSQGINWIYQRNLNFLEDYLRYHDLSVSEDIENRIVSLVNQNLGLTLSDLLNEVNFDSDSIYILLSTNIIYFDIEKNLLTEPEHVRIFADKTTADAFQYIQVSGDTSINLRSFEIKAGAWVTWDEVQFQIANLGSHSVALLNPNKELAELSNELFMKCLTNGTIKGIELSTSDTEIDSEVKEILADASPEHIAVANFRYQVLQDQISAPRISERTIRDWQTRFSIAEQRYGTGYLGLLPQTHKRSNRNAKISEPVRELLREFIPKVYETKKQKSKTVVYGQFQNLCKEKGLDSPSR